VISHHVFRKGSDSFVTRFFQCLFRRRDVNDTGGISDMRNLRIGKLSLVFGEYEAFETNKAVINVIFNGKAIGSFLAHTEEVDREISKITKYRTICTATEHMSHTRAKSTRPQYGTAHTHI
jgi:hypothetical protein